MLEWLQRHAWKACIRQKRIPGSNPGLSANKKPKPLTAIAGFRFLFLFSRTGQLTFLNSKALLLNAENISKMPRSAS